MTEAMGYKSFMTVGATYCSFISHDIKETVEIVQDEGIRGTRSRVLERLAQGNKHVAGTITMEPTPAEMAAIFQYVANSGAGNTLTDAMQDVTVIVDSITKKYTFLGRFNTLHLTGEPGKKVQCHIGFIGKTCTVAATSLSGTPDITARPYMFSDVGSGITIGSTTYAIDKFDIGIDNKIEPTFMMGQTATDLEPTDRIVTLGFQTKYNAAEDALLVIEQAGPVIASPLTGSIALSNSTSSNSITFTFGALVATSNTVTIPNKKHLRLPHNFQAFRVGSTLEAVPVIV